MFQLPIEYVPHTELNETLRKDIELDTVYEHMMQPTNEVVAKRYSRFITSNVTFLKESSEWHKALNEVKASSAFREEWQTLSEESDFAHTFQYFEMKWLQTMNRSSLALLALSLYFVVSPLMCLATPIIMMFIPIALITLRKDPVEWCVYCRHLKQVFSQHAVVKLFSEFSTATLSQRLYLFMSAALFAVQIYSNVHGYLSHRANMMRMGKVFESMGVFLEETLEAMGKVQSIKLGSFVKFQDAVDNHRIVLSMYHERLKRMQPTLLGSGRMRAMFYELHENEQLKESVEYALQFNGYLRTVHVLNGRIGKVLHECEYGKVTTFEKAYYPFASRGKNSYEAVNMVVTGPNASGKTTLLKATMINVVLSQQIGCGHYMRATVCPYDSLASYLNIPDTSGRDSLFQAEARRCKEIMEEAEKGKRMFCILDELYSGTNTEEAEGSSVALLEHLSSIPTFTFMLTTHFTKVCEALPQVCMKHMDGDSYTYRLKDGISYVKGASRVLKEFKLPGA